MPTAGDAQVTQAWLRSTWQVQVPQTWLDACVEWVLEEAAGAAVPQARLNQQVLEQWLLTDLRDLAHPILPVGVSEAEKMELNGCYCLQVDSLLDVSQPAYSQLQRVRGADCTNEQVTAVTQATQKPWEAKPTRMLILQLTDGVQSLEGMEYQPIPALNSSLPPGTKLQVVGKVVVRLGVLLLKSENVRVLGGEVEQLVERHSQARVLCRTLGLPEENQMQGAEPNDQELLASVEAVGERQIGGASVDSGYDSNGGSLILRASVGPQQSYSHQVEPSLQVTTPFNSHNLDDSQDDDIPDNFDYVPEDFDDIPENFDDIPENFGNAPEDFDDIPMEELDSMMTPTETEVFPRNGAMEFGGMEQPTIPSSDSGRLASHVNQPTAGGRSHLSFASGTPVNEHNSYRRGSTDQMAVIGDLDGSFSSPEPKMARYDPLYSSTQMEAQVSAHKHSNKVSADMSVLNYLCILQAGVWLPSTVQVVRLQAFIVTLLGNLRNSGGEWKLGATISDGTAYLDVDLCDTLLTNLIGFSATESRTLRKDPAMRGVVDAGIQNCQRELVDMCCVMNVRLEPSGKSVLLRTDPLTDRECCELQRRVTERRS
ncbi:recQ-mediated genome instability protein 1 [Colossoma macropomum]|uniref:recQ-mediated genome instability protein 1 n=1 Tax=Colossoma macropomum TaxID=42526 RepID=UPI0018648EA9|nr:recQ-mediated genome instability protein 1 [Colossoma macropomum]